MLTDHSIALTRPPGRVFAVGRRQSGYTAVELVVVMVLRRRQGWIDFRRELRLVPIVALGALGGWGASAAYVAMVPSGG